MTIPRGDLRAKQEGSACKRENRALRAEIRRMKPVVAAAIRWMRFQSGTNSGELYEAAMQYAGEKADLPGDERRP